LAIHPEAPGDSEVSKAYCWYVVIVLLLIYSLNFLDRSVINILGEQIKRNLAISDTQLGLLTGTSFALFYSLMGLPIARMADRVHRVRLVAVALLLWSGLTAICGATTSYIQLFVARMGVGIGEAGGTPPSQSIIADYFPHARRGTAIALFNTGVPLGTFLGFLIGGFVSQAYGWRVTFLVVGIPGVLVALLLYFTVREPIRGSSDGLQEAARDVPPLGKTLKKLFGRPSYFKIVCGASCGIGITFIGGAWLPSMFIRLHHFTPAQIGGWMALFTGIGGAIGSFGGGALADHLKRSYPKAEIYVPAIATALAFPAFLVAALARDPAIGLIGMAGVFSLGYVWIGPNSAMVHRVVPIRSRALAIGFMLFFANITALAMGPPLVGALSDALAGTYGPDSLRYALAVASFICVLGAGFYLWAGRYYLEDARINADPNAQ
jgi:predicted MFS family arabinose efflux permease